MAATTAPSSGTASPRCGRPLTTSYVDLMRPDEDWRNLPDAAERRKIQNRLAQRAYRRNMRDRTKEVERLKKQLQQLQGSLGQSRASTPPPEQESPSGGSSAASLANGSVTPPMMTGAPEYQHWSHPAGQEQLSGLGIRQDGDASMGFGTPAFFHGMSGSGEMVTGIATPPSSTTSSSGRRSRAVTASITSQGSMPSAQHLRSNSTGPLSMTPNCGSPMPHWSQADRRESMPVTAMSSAHGSPLMASVPREGFNMCSTPEDVGFIQAKAPYSMEQEMAHYPPPPEAEMPARTGWAPTSMDATNSSPLGSGFVPNVNFHDVPDMSKGIPETTAPLLHFAVSSGNMDTLRFLLQRPDINLNGLDNAGYTPLQRAVSLGNTDMVAVLIEHGAIVDSPTFKEPSYDHSKAERHA